MKQDYTLNEHTTTVVLGENGSGKSIYLKTLGNLVHLAQIGSFVPCEYASLPIFDKILTKFQTPEDPEMKRSLFYQEAKDIKCLIESVSSDSLVLIDEYARATSNLNSQALYLTLVEYLSNTECEMNPPLVLMTTNMK